MLQSQNDVFYSVCRIVTGDLLSTTRLLHSLWDVWHLILRPLWLTQYHTCARLEWCHLTHRLKFEIYQTSVLTLVQDLDGLLLD